MKSVFQILTPLHINIELDNSDVAITPLPSPTILPQSSPTPNVVVQSQGGGGGGSSSPSSPASQEKREEESHKNYASPPRTATSFLDLDGPFLSKSEISKITRADNKALSELYKTYNSMLEKYLAQLMQQTQNYQDEGVSNRDHKSEEIQTLYSELYNSKEEIVKLIGSLE